jgi:hypothetical protein
MIDPRIERFVAEDRAAGGSLIRTLVAYAAADLNAMAAAEALLIHVNTPGPDRRAHRARPAPTRGRHRPPDRDPPYRPPARMTRPGLHNEQVRLRDGSSAVIRPVEPTDKASSPRALPS